MKSTSTRRNFLKTSAGALAGSAMSYWMGTGRAAAADFKSPNEQPVVAFVGCGIRYHTALGRGATAFGPCAAVCDLDSIQAGRALQVAVDQHREHGHPITVATYDDYRRVLDRKDVDIVVNATPDQWHTKVAVEAMQAGKDLYSEKPLTLTIREGQQLLDVMKKTKRVVQVGTQQRTEYGRMFAKAVLLVRAGRAGAIKRVTCALGPARICDALPVTKPPKTLDWNRWLGQAPWAEYRQGELVDVEGWGAGFPFSRAHRYYRWWYEYSGGKLTDWGAHHIDIAAWALDKARSDVGHITIEPLSVNHPVPFVDGMPTEDDRFNTAVEFDVRMTFADGIEMRVRHDASDDLGFDNGIMFEGSKGRFLVNRGKLVGKPVEEEAANPLAEDALEKLYGCPAPKSHMQNFMDCVKSRNMPISDVESHTCGLDICHAINIAMRLGRKLVYDPAAKQFVGDKQANTFIERPQRKGFEIVV